MAVPKTTYHDSERAGRERTRCPKCRYEIGNIGVERCSECGHEIVWQAVARGWLVLSRRWVLGFLLLVFALSAGVQFTLIRSHAYSLHAWQGYNAMYLAKATTESFQKRAKDWAADAELQKTYPPPEIAGDQIFWPTDFRPTWNDALLVIFRYPRPSLFTGWGQLLIVAASSGVLLASWRRPLSEAGHRRCVIGLWIVVGATALQTGMIVSEVLWV